MRSRALLALVVAVVGSSLLAGPASAHRSPVRQEVRKILKACSNDRPIHGHPSLKALRRALRLVVMSDDLRYYTRCERVIRRAIRKAQRKLRREVRRIYRDCSRDDDLDRSYSLAGLRLALRWLPDDLQEYTGCERAIRRAIRKARRHHRRHHHHHHHRVYAVSPRARPVSG